MNGPQEWEAAGVYDPSSPDAPQRLELLEWLVDQGVGIEEIVEACPRGQLTSIVGDRKLCAPVGG